MAERAAAETRVCRQALRGGFADTEQARAAMLDGGEQAQARACVSEWATQAARLAAAAAIPEFDGLDPATGPEAETRAQAARDALAATDSAAQRSADAAELARHRLARFAARRAEVVTAQADLDRLDSETAPVLYLSRLTKGMAGRRRVALTTYVLRHWFEQVVRAANVRLASVSSGRYELLRIDEGPTHAARAGLTLAVIDRHTGEQRSTRSLSGGETFYTSLALALGLADVVKAEAGGVDLDTLFIDEGFGSLDSDTLDQVMTVIDELRDRGRVVGIVSHVSELKDRIAERVEVRRLPDGSSCLRVVA
jgi:DNA repair protein SbcC/Rad50